MQKLLSLTSKDFEWDYVRGSGHGGQKKNKTSSAVQCRHAQSGAIGYSEASRSQLENRETAFKHMANSKEFQAWAKVRSLELMGDLERIEKKIDAELSNSDITRIEGKDEEGRWSKI